MLIVDDIFQSFSLPFNPPVMRRVTWETINSTLNVTLCEILSPHRVGHPQTRLWGSNSWGDLAPDQTDGCDIFAIPDRHRSRASWWMEAGIFQLPSAESSTCLRSNAVVQCVDGDIYVCIIIVYYTSVLIKATSLCKMFSYNLDLKLTVCFHIIAKVINY